MINPIPLRHRLRCKNWLRRLDRTAANLNIILAVLAIGLAVLDGTLLVTQQVIRQLPPMRQAVAAAELTPSDLSIAGTPLR